MTLADRLTLARVGLAPMAACAYLFLPIQGQVCFLVAALLCGLAEATDWLDGKVARARGEVSDFGKLADPFCDVVYRSTLFLVLLLPAGGIGLPAERGSIPVIEAPVYWLASDVLGAGLVPWLPVVLMVVREIVAGALRAMAATRGLVLAARFSGKAKAWAQGFTIITVLALPVVTGDTARWQLDVALVLTWTCALLSLASLGEYLHVNRATLAALLDHR